MRLSPHAPAIAASAACACLVPAQLVVVLQRAASSQPKSSGQLPAFNMTGRAANPPSDNGRQPSRPALTTTTPAPTPTPPANHPPVAVARHSGHELPFVTPSTYLHQRASTATATPNVASAAAPHVSSHSRTIPPPALILAPETPPPMTPLDRDQVQGLVSRNHSSPPLCWTRISGPRHCSPLTTSCRTHALCGARRPPSWLPVPRWRPSLLTCLVRRTSCAACIWLRGTH